MEESTDRLIKDNGDTLDRGILFSRSVAMLEKKLLKFSAINVWSVISTSSEKN